MILTLPKLSRRLLLPLLLMPMLLFFAGTALAEVVGRITRIEGMVDIMPGGQLPAVAARSGSPVQKGDFVRTKSNGRAEITFNDGSVIKIAPRSRIDVGEYSASGRQLGLPRGKVQAAVVPAAAGSAPRSFEIRTPNAIAGVRGTLFFVLHENNVTGVVVAEGTVHTTSLAKQSQGVTLVAGTATTVGRGQAPTPPRRATERELNNHQNDVTPAANQGADSGSEGAPSGSQEGSSEASSESSAASPTAQTESRPTAETESSPTAETESSSAETDSASSTSSSNTTSSDNTTSTGGTAEPITIASSGGSLPPDSTFFAPMPEAPETAPPTTPPTQPFVPPPGNPSPIVTPPATEQQKPAEEPPPSEPTPSEPTPTDPTPTEPPPNVFSSHLGAGLMSRDASIDPVSNLLTIVSDGGLALQLTGTSLWTGSAQATLSGAYPALPLLQPNHYWFGKLFSGDDPATHTTTDGGAYFGYFGGMSLDGSGASDTTLAALYIDPTGKTGVMQGSIPGTITAGTLSGTGTLTLTEMTPISGLNPAALTANWWDSSTGSTIVELTGPVLTGEPEPTGTTGTTGTTGGTTGTTTTSGGYDRNESEGFLLDANLNITSDMSNRGDVLRLAHLASDPSFGIWTRESFGTFDGTNTNFALISNAEWGTLNSMDGTFTTDDEIKVISIGNWQSDGSLTGKADGVWGNLATGGIKILTGTLTGSSNAGTNSFGAVTTGSYIDPARFLADPSLAAQLGFPTLQSPDSFSLSGTGSTSGSVSIANINFYRRNSSDPVALWISQNVTGTYSGDLRHQSFSLMDGSTAGSSNILGSMRVTSVNPATGSATWIGSLNAMGETGTSFRSDFDGIVAGTFTGTTFTGTAAGLSHPITYYSTISGATTQLTRYQGGAVNSYGSLDGVMGGISLWQATPTLPSEFYSIGFFTPTQTLTEYDYVMSAPIQSKDIPSGTGMTADGGAYQGHIVAGVTTTGVGPQTPGISGVMSALYIDPDGNSGVIHGEYQGYLDTMSNLWMGDGDIVPVTLSTAPSDVAAATLNSGGVITATTPFSVSDAFFGGSLSVFGWAPGTFTRSYISSTPDWGIGQFGLYTAYSVAPAANSPWMIDFNITNAAMRDVALVGMMSGEMWDPASGRLTASTRAGWYDTLAAQAAATPMTGIFIGETVGTFNPASLQAMTSGIWLETSKFLGLASTTAGQATLQKLNIPAVEVGRASFTGSNGEYDVTIGDLRFFAPVTGGRPQVFATDNVSGNYSVATPTNVTVNLTQVPNVGVAASGLAPTFSIKEWDTTNNKWTGKISYEGTTGVVGTHPGIQFMGTAAGRTSGGTTGTFTGTAAGVVR